MAFKILQNRQKPNVMSWGKGQNYKTQNVEVEKNIKIWKESECQKLFLDWPERQK